MQEFYYKYMEDGNVFVIGYYGDDTEVVIPNQYNGYRITVLYDDLFKGHSEITIIRMPDTITDFGEFIFDGCTNLRHLQLPTELSVLWGYTFVRSGLEEITLPDKIQTIPPFAFKDYKNLKKVICGAGMKKICSWAFSGCDNLTELIHAPKVEVSPDTFMTKELNK